MTVVKGRASSLNEKQRTAAYALLLKAVTRLMSRPTEVDYTEGATRWDGIEHKKNMRTTLAKFFPFYGDCESTASWLLWLVLAHMFHLKDHVNGEGWLAGWTGTGSKHGLRVTDVDKLRVGDLVFYGPAPDYSHVAMSIGGRRVFSHGSPDGPYILDIDYRPDRGVMKRYI